MAKKQFLFQILQTSIPKVIDIRLSESLNLDTAKIGMAVASIYIVSGLMNYIGGILADKYSEKMIYVSGILGQALLLFVVASTSNAALWASSNAWLKICVYNSVKVGSLNFPPRPPGNLHSNAVCSVHVSNTILF